MCQNDIFYTTFTVDALRHILKFSLSLSLTNRKDIITAKEAREGLNNQPSIKITLAKLEGP